MKLSNPFQMNDWQFIPFLKVVIVLHLVFLGFMALNIFGLSIPVIQPLISFLYIIFIPGILILRILRLHNLGSIETVLYSVGLSIALLMFTGFVMNMVYPLFGIQRPFAPIPMIFTISGIILILSGICYARDKDFSISPVINISNRDYPIIFSLSLIPCISVLGTYLMNFYYNNVLLMFMIVVIALVALLIGFDRFIPAKFYPLAIFMLALSLLFHRSLISMNLWGWDILTEYYFANQVIENSFWDATIPNNVNAMLSIVSLVPFLSSICGMNVVWVLKIIFPVIFSFVPLGLFRAVQKQADERIAFFAMFFFISIFTFYSEMLSLARQQMAELFLVLTILLMIDKTMDKTKRLLLLCIFGASIIVSHYGLTWIYFFSLIAAWILLSIGENQRIIAFKERIFSIIRRDGNNYEYKHQVGIKTISLPYVLFFVIFTLFWYISFSSGSVIESSVNIGESITTSISEDFLNPEAVQGLGLIIREAPSPLRTISKYFHIFTIFFIVVGLPITLIARDKFKFANEYFAFSEINLIVCICGVTLPFFASALNSTRLYHITLLFLAPFCIIGGLIVFSSIFRPLFRLSPYKVASVFFVIFLFFNSGFIDEISTSESSSIALDQTKLEGTIDSEIYNNRAVSGAQWLYGVQNSFIYADATQQNLWRGYGDIITRRLPENSNEIRDNSYLFLGTYNVLKKQIRVLHTEKAYTYEMYIDSSNIIWDNNKIFANGGAEIYYN